MPLIMYNMLSLDRKGQEEIQKEWVAEPVLPESQNMSIELLNSGPAPSGPIGARVWREFRIDPLGWKKTIRILNIVLKFKDTVKHKTFRGYSVVECQRCQDNHQKSKDILFKYESQIIVKTISSKQLSKFTKNERLVYFHRRISNENPFKSKDLDRIPLVDTWIIRNPLPVVMKDSPLLYSLGIQPKVDDIVMFIFKDSGYSKGHRTWKLGKVTQIQPRKITIEYFSKVSIQGISMIGSVSRNRRDISFTFLTDELFINTPEHFKDLFNQKTKIDCNSVIGFLDFKMIKPNSGVQSKILYLLTNLKLKVFKTYSLITNYVSHAYCSREKGKLTELRSEEMRKIVEERIRLARSTAPQGSSDLLIRQPQVISGVTKKTFNPENLVSIFVGYSPVMGRKQDESCMKKYLNRISGNGLQDPSIGLRSAFLPEGTPLLEYLAVYQEKMDSWKYPSREEINIFKRGRGLSLKMIQEVEVQEVIVGETRPDQIKEVEEWFWERWLYVQEKCPTQVVSLDNEQVSLTYDIWRMSGKIEMTGSVRRSKEKELARSGAALEEDRLIPVPAKIMLGDGFRFSLIISMVLKEDRDGEYLIRKLEIQEELLDFHEQIPVATGVGVAKDITGIEFFYSTVSNHNLEMKASDPVDELELETQFHKVI